MNWRVISLADANYEPLSRKVHYVYRHVRLDTGEVFYVGIGVKNLKGKKAETVYKRAFSHKKGSRSNFWFKVAKKSKYEVEILFECISLEEACKKEAEFIRLYGRKDLKTGTLVNLCEGGLAPYNRSKESLENSRRIMTKLAKRGSDNPFSKRVWVYRTSGDFYGDFVSHTSAADSLGIQRCSIRLVLDGITQRCDDFIFFEDYQGPKAQIQLKPHSKIRSIQCFDLNMNLVQEFPSVTKAAEYLGVARTNISQACKSPERICRGHHLKYKD